MTIKNVATTFPILANWGPTYVTKMYWPYMRELVRYGKKALVAVERPMGLPLLPKPLERFIRSPKTQAIFAKTAVLAV